MRLLVEATNAAVGVDGNRLVSPAGRFDVVLRVPDGELRPGLVNAHDHLHRNHYGRLGHPPYVDAYAWGRDIHTRERRAIAAARARPRREALARGAWKNLVAGVTTVVHHDPWEPAFDDAFPLRVARLRCAHSLRLEPDLDRCLAGTGPFAIHLAEGTDAGAADEVRELARRGLLGPELLAVHVVGADDDGVRRLREAGAAIVWCPTSNLFLFDRTAPPALLAPGTDVLLGSDSLLTGAGTLLDELRAARALGLVADERLEAAVGATAARRLGLPTPSLAPGAHADLVVLRRPLLEATASDVALVIADGVPRVLAPELAPALGAARALGRPATLHGVTRWICDQACESWPGASARGARPSGGTCHDTRPASSRRTRP
ncbi:MAG TPA: amidohydrolase family protein [Gemmatimonadaceae bacterium]|nr:amidohydrolase family protein [Gemmatimonadaceae bacterium]